MREWKGRKRGRAHAFAEDAGVVGAPHVAGVAVASLWVVSAVSFALLAVGLQRVAFDRT